MSSGPIATGCARHAPAISPITISHMPKNSIPNASAPVRKSKIARYSAAISTAPSTMWDVTLPSAQIDSSTDTCSTTTQT